MKLNFQLGNRSDFESQKRENNLTVNTISQIKMEVIMLRIANHNEIQIICYSEKY